MTPERAVEILAEIQAAVENQGRFPEHHRKVMRRHRLEWPTLWNAIDKIWEPAFYDEIPVGVEGMNEPPGQ